MGAGAVVGARMSRRLYFCYHVNTVSVADRRYIAFANNKLNKHSLDATQSNVISAYRKRGLLRTPVRDVSCWHPDPITACRRSNFDTPAIGQLHTSRVQPQRFVHRISSIIRRTQSQPTFSGPESGGNMLSIFVRRNLKICLVCGSIVFLGKIHSRII